MVVFALVFALVALSVAGLAAGALMGRGPLRKTCASGGCCKAVRCPGCPRAAGPEEGP